MSRYSLVIPIYRNEDNILSLFSALKNVDAQLDYDCEFIFVNDGSPDASETIILENRNKFLKTSKVITLSRNFGSFTAIRAGMACAEGAMVAVMAADLQEPPELIIEMFETLSSGCADVCFGERKSRHDPFGKKVLSNVFWALYRRLVIPEVPSGGVDIFACNQHVIKSILSIEERNSSLIAQLFWVGFRRCYIPYDRKKREVGESGWGFSKRFRYMLDSIFSFTDIPIMSLLVLGTLGLVLSLIYIVIVGFSYALGFITQPGFTSQTILLTIFGSSILLSQGILGCYIWRTLENTKKRPLYIIENVTKDDQ